LRLVILRVVETEPLPVQEIERVSRLRLAETEQKSLRPRLYRESEDEDEDLEYE
jgi:hypothetical protein